MPRPRPPSALRWSRLAGLGLVLGCGGPGAKPAAGADDTAAPERPAGDGHDSGPPRDTGAPETGDAVLPAARCRSLDPDWGAAHRASDDPVDAELADIIEARDLLGDPTLYVDGDGRCRQRRLPGPTDPLALLGRALFHSPVLSGDGDTACATCHHPLLAGADALVLPAGVGGAPEAVGADRVAGTTDIARLRGARNTPSVFNAGLWDRALMWDGRIEAVDPAAGFNGSVGGITTPDGPSAAPDLVAAQALLPLAHPHELAGSAATDPAGAVAAAVARLAEDDAWVDAFAAPCADPEALPASWRAACGAADGAGLVTADHLARALSAHQRSMVFADSPWAAYVQGDVDALPAAAKAGALLFYRPPDAGGLNCGACHTGDRFTDEAFHAVGAAQIGPGDPLLAGTPGVDAGRAAISGDPADTWAFRTPSLLNVAATAPYFHAGAVPTLFRAVLHYRGVETSLEQSFGVPGEPLRRPPPWCSTAWFRDIADCESLYDIDATHGGDRSVGLDGELVGIDTATNASTVLVELFLESLSDRRLGDPEALAPWIPPAAPGAPTPTATSDEWPERCGEMVEWDQTMDLRVKGARWLATGALPPGVTPTTGLAPFAAFGRSHWTVFGQRHRHLTGRSSHPASVGAGVLALVPAASRAALLDAYADRAWDDALPPVAEARAAVFAQLQAWRTEGAPPAAETRSATLAGLLAPQRGEAAGIAALARAHGAAWAVLPDAAAHRQALRAYLAGDHTGLPAEMRELPGEVLRPTAALARELADRGLVLDAALGEHLLRYATATAGPDCVGGFDPRQDFGGQAAAHTGFSPWIEDWIFNLETGTQDPLATEQELAALVARLESAVGHPGPAPVLDAVAQARRAGAAARADRAAAALALGRAVAAGADPAPAEAALFAAQDALLAAEADQLAAELGYQLGLWFALGPAEQAALQHWVACLEDPATQALRDHGGFGRPGACLPD